MKTSGYVRILLTAVLSLVLLVPCGTAAYAAAALMPNVTADMTVPSYWTARIATPGDMLLATPGALEERYRGALETKDCYMTDMLATPSVYDQDVLQRRLFRQAMKDLSDYMGTDYYDADGDNVAYYEALSVLESIANTITDPEREVLYGIAVEMTNVRAVPSDTLITDSAGDNDFDLLQISTLRTNEPVFIRSENDDGSWLYVDSSAVSGWVPAECIAICSDREEWLEAWNIPEEEALVVTQGRILLDQSNVNPYSSGRVLTMGTVLRKVSEQAYDQVLTNRASYYNYPVYLPVRAEDGSYDTTIGLIPMHCSVSEGYLPLTTDNILQTAFSMLGDAYGWGGMLSVPDCSQYIKDIYKCVGMELPRNTTWQSAMPSQSFDLTDLEPEAKAAILDELPAGTILFFRGHEMMYLGSENGLHYVLSSVSSMMDPESDERLRVRSVIINTLEDTRRANGNTWMEDLNKAVIPYLPAAEAEVEAEAEAAAAAVAEAEVEAEDVTAAAAEEATPSDYTEEAPAEETEAAEEPAEEMTAETEAEPADETEPAEETVKDDIIKFKKPETAVETIEEEQETAAATAEAMHFTAHGHEYEHGHGFGHRSRFPSRYKTGIHVFPRIIV